MRVVFLGTPEFAVPSLRALVEAGHEVLSVFTQPDRPKGRGNAVTFSPVKEAGLNLNLPVKQPERVRRPDSVAILRELQPDIMVVVGYGQIIPQTIIDIPPYGILNVHASLLPKYRGAAPIQWAIANGESETGVTIMRIDAGLDTGDMLAKAHSDIGVSETAPELSVRLASMGAELLIRSIENIGRGEAVYQEQDDADATLAPILKKEDGQVDWTKTATVIFNRWRGFNPWPGGFTTFRDGQLTIANATPANQELRLHPGVLSPQKRRLFVSCGDNTTLELLELQPAGKKRMTAEAFMNGYRVESGEELGRSGR